jgi:hypothetical protein
MSENLDVHKFRNGDPFLKRKQLKNGKKQMNPVTLMKKIR